MATDPISGARYPLETDSGDVALWMQRGVNDVSTQGVPRFSTTTVRDNAYSAAITAGTITSIADGTVCSVAGVPYRRINGTWRINRPRAFYRQASLGSTGSIISGGSVETGVTSGASLTGGSGNTFTLYEAGTVIINAQFRAGNPGTALCTVKIDGSTVGNVAVSRGDGTVGVTAAAALAAGSHSVSMRVDTSGGGVTWTDGALTIAEFTAE